MLHEPITVENRFEALDITPTQLGRSIGRNYEFVAVVIMRLINGGSPSQMVKSFVRIIRSEHNTLQQLIIGVMFRVLVELGRKVEDWEVDARNETSINACRRLSQMVDDEEITVWFPLI